MGDVRFGIRLLVRSPIFTAAAVLLLGIGISANTLIFSAVDALLLRPLPVSHPENLVRLIEVHPGNFITWKLPYRLCDALAAKSPSLSEVLCQGEADVAFSGGDSTERVRVHLVSPNFFSSLGTGALIGRVLTAEDERTAAPNAVLSYDFWRRRFRGDPAVLGRAFRLHDRVFTIVGVTPRGFNGLTVDTTPDLRVPAAVDRLIVDPMGDIKTTDRPMYAEIFGRLRAGVIVSRADAEVDPLLRPAYDALMEQWFPGAKGSASNAAMQSRLRLEPIENGVSILRSQFSRGLEILMAGVALLLAMACANVAGLLLARSTIRAQEIGIRLALGAGPGRIVRQLLTESFVLALLGGIIGMLFTYACLPLLTRALPPIRDRAAVILPVAVHIAVDWRVLLFALAITLATAVLFGLSPALQAARTDLAATLRGGRTTTRRLFTRNLIVIAQVAVCTLVLIAAALLVQTLERMRSMNPGFDRDHIVTFTIDTGLRGYNPEQSRAFSRRLLEQTRSLPSVAAASLASRAVMRGTGLKATYGVAGTRIAKNDFLNASNNSVTPGYFETMGMRLLAGRDFTWSDDTKTRGARKVIVNQAFAQHFFHSRNPLRQRFGFGGTNGIAQPQNEIVGVVSDAKYRSLRESIPPTVYFPVVGGFDSEFILHVRTYGPPVAIAGSVREVLRSLDARMPLFEVKTLREEVEASLWQERLLGALGSIFGAIAALLAGIGLYGALDYAVKSRAREIGIRMALGAEPVRIARLLSCETLLPVACGVVLGMTGYAVSAAWIHQALYNVRAWDPVALGSVVLLIGVACTVSAAAPVLKAVRTDPVAALRVE